MDQVQQEPLASFDDPGSGIVPVGTAHEHPPSRHAPDGRLAGHVPALDGVRGIAIAMVLALHFIANTAPTTRFERALCSVLGCGRLGVDLFFALSGWLITGILIDAKGRDGYFRNFYMRRTLRIFPLYYAVLVAFLVVAPLIPFCAGPELDTLRAEQGWAWFYGVNIHTAMRGDFSFPYIDHFWSLAIEEHFYLFWPLVVWACSRRTLVVVSAIIAFLSLAARLVAAAMNVNEMALYVLTPFRLDALCMGAFLAACARAPGGLDTLRRAVAPTAVGAVVVLAASYVVSHVAPTLYQPAHQLRLAIYTVFFGVLLVLTLTARPGGIFARAVSAAPLRFLGTYSYGLYVFHHFLSYYMVSRDTVSVFGRLIGSHTLALFLQATVATGISLGVAIVSYQLFEKRFLALKRYWAPPVVAGAVPRVESQPIG